MDEGRGALTRSHSLAEGGREGPRRQGEGARIDERARFILGGVRVRLGG